MEKREIDSGIQKTISFENECNDILDTQNQKYVRDVLDKLEIELPDRINRDTILLGSMIRKLNSPKEITLNGLRKGIWRESKFVLEDDFIPSNINNTNPEQLTIQQIKSKLNEKYGIKLDGIPYQDGVADFRSISIANISTEEMFTTITGMSQDDYKALNSEERLKNYTSVFSKRKRERNFLIADRIVSEKQIYIPGLEEGYTREQLTKWRKENKFSWDEQVKWGYNLVPTIIHQNIAHTGLVSIAENAFINLEEYTYRIKKNPTTFCWEDVYAPISIEELYNCNDIIKLKTKGDMNMPMRRVYSRGMNLGRHCELSYDEINKEASDGIAEGSRLGELAKQFISDKNKLEDEIEKVQASKISNKDKASIISQLNASIELLQLQYEEDVEEEERRIQEELEGQIEEMQEAADELEKQANDLRGIQMEVASTDAVAAADVADEKRQMFEEMKSECVEKLKLQIEQAEIHQREIKNRRLSRR